MVGFCVAEKSFDDSFERFGGAIGVVPKQHFDQMNHFMFHDSLQSLEPVATNDSTDDSGRFVFKSCKQRRRCNCDFEFSRWISTVARGLHGRHPASACHARRKPKRKRSVGLLLTKPIDASFEKILVGDVKQQPKIRAANFTEVARADRTRVGQHVLGNRSLSLLAAGSRKLPVFDDSLEFGFGWTFAGHLFFD